MTQKRTLSPWAKIALICAVVFFGFALLLGLLVVGEYNSLVAARNNTDKAWSKVEIQYQRRVDLLGNLVESVKSSQVQEQKVFGDIAKARSNYQNASNPDDKAKAANQIETNVALIPKLQEAYPELRSNDNVKELMLELHETEGGIATVRSDYNDKANDYNTSIERFPRSLFASTMGFKERTLFKSEAGAAQAPKIKLTN